MVEKLLLVNYWKCYKKKKVVKMHDYEDVSEKLNEFKEFLSRFSDEEAYQIMCKINKQYIVNGDFCLDNDFK